MSIRQGFYRIEMIYWRRWWIVLIAPPLIFAYRIFTQPAPSGIDPALWFWAKPTLLGLISVLALVLLTWIALGFIAPQADWEVQLEEARRAASKIPKDS